MAISYEAIVPKEPTRLRVETSHFSRAGHEELTFVE
jgi:hypothetical protein